MLTFTLLYLGASPWFLLLFPGKLSTLFLSSSNKCGSQLAARPRQPQQRAIKDPSIDQYPPKDKAS